MKLRMLNGVRAWVGGIAVLSGLAGFIFVVEYFILRRPSATDQVLDPSKNDVTYAVPSWLLHAGVIMLAASAIVFSLSYLTSPPWRPGMRLAGSERTDAAVRFATIATVTVSVAVVVLAGWHSPNSPLFVVVPAIVLLWVWYGKRWHARHDL